MEWRSRPRSREVRSRCQAARGALEPKYRDIPQTQDFAFIDAYFEKERLRVLVRWRLLMGLEWMLRFPGAG